MQLPVNLHLVRRAWSSLLPQLLHGEISAVRLALRAGCLHTDMEPQAMWVHLCFLLLTAPAAGGVLPVGAAAAGRGAAAAEGRTGHVMAGVAAGGLRDDQVPPLQAATRLLLDLHFSVLIALLGSMQNADAEGVIRHSGQAVCV